MTRPAITPLPLLLFCGFLFTGGSASAQEVRWRSDYSAARREATETGKPLLLDFGTEACFWCKKLDATTFRDPKVVKLLNERFVPVKIDAQRDERLTTALQIEGFPTLILATAAGKVIGRHAGYADVGQLMTLLNKAPVAVPPTPSGPTMPKVPAALIAPPSPQSAAEKQQLHRAELDAGLTALFPEIAAALDR
jgi:thioredoxin-like negative regulator of GroEL